MQRSPARLSAANASAPFVATLVDVSGQVINFTVAYLGPLL
jgi:Mg/Co/Ni transporter MgtE